MTTRAAKRQQRYRERQERGLVVVSVELSPEAVDTLHRIGFLKLAEVEDREAIARGVAELLESMVARGDA